MKFNFDTILVHGGTFHADDVMSVALCEILNPCIKVKREFCVPDKLPETTLVADIGGGKYDHHQVDAKIREDGLKRAACGLIFEDYGHLLFSKNGYKIFEKNYIIPIEDIDNGVGGGNPLSSFISSLNPFWDSADPETETKEGFRKAVDFCKEIISRNIARDLAMGKAKTEVEEALKGVTDNGLIILKKYIPPIMFVGTEAKLLVMPSNRGGWNILTIKVDKDSSKDIICLPEEWLENKPEGCTFVHTARFIAAFNTKGAAITAAKTVLNQTQ